MQVIDGPHTIELEPSTEHQMKVSKCDWRFVVCDALRIGIIEVNELQTIPQPYFVYAEYPETLEVTAGLIVVGGRLWTAEHAGDNRVPVGVVENFLG